MTKHYRCDICRNDYGSAESALACEAKGYFNRAKFPVGFMFEYEHNGYVGIFALPPGDKDETPFHNNHLGMISYWACRVPELPGDSLDEQCGGNLVGSSNEEVEEYLHRRIVSKSHIDGPEINRMIKFLRSQNIVPTYYNSKRELITVK